MKVKRRVREGKRTDNKRCERKVSIIFRANKLFWREGRKSKRTSVCGSVT